MGKMKSQKFLYQKLLPLTECHSFFSLQTYTGITTTGGGELRVERIKKGRVCNK